MSQLDLSDADVEKFYRLALSYAELCRAQESWNEAESWMRQALGVKPNSGKAHYFLGITLSALGRLDEAEVSYRRALEIMPDYLEVYNNLVVTLSALGRLEEVRVMNRFLHTKRDWEGALRCLTTPLVLTTGMVLSPIESSRAISCKQVSASQKHVVRLTHSQQSVAEKQKLILPVAEESESVIFNKLRIMLIYPPPWQIPNLGEALHGMPFGQPIDKSDRNLDRDFKSITYGLLTIAAQAKRAGHEVCVYNLCTSSWQDVVALIAETEADVYGISAFTANRRGMGAVAKLIRQYHPQAHITVGGPFVTALPLDTLRYFPDIDTAVIGEGEETFMELLERLGVGRSVAGIPGTAWRDGNEITVGPIRPRIKDLDALASPFDYFTSNIVMTSRGCPDKCTFCGSIATWGTKLRFQSIESCLDTFRKALARLPVPFLAVKDDTFTAHRRRTIAICDAIIESNMNFLWSCDTRVDSLDDEMLRKMRLAGCQMISLGVETGSLEILKTMRKGTTPEMVLKTTRLAQKYGVHVRYYMILGNRGETAESIQQSIDLIKVGRPNSFFSCALSFYPGTEDWEFLRAAQGLTPDIFFQNDFMELNIAINRRDEANDIHRHVECSVDAFNGQRNGFDYTVKERESVAERLIGLHCVHVELANAYFRNGRFDDAMSALDQAVKLDFPIDGIIYNQRACIALACGEVENALLLLERALHCHPHQLVKNNLTNLRTWVDRPVDGRGQPTSLNDSVDAIDFMFYPQMTKYP